MSDATQLLPCPFCDSINIKEGHIRDGRHIACQNCGASVCAYHPTASADARAKWNRRAGKAAWVPDKPTPPCDSLDERLSRLEAVVETLKPAAAPSLEDIEIEWNSRHGSHTRPLWEEIKALRWALRNALSFTYPRHDTAMWRVAAIEALPEVERERFRDMLAGQQRGSL